MIICWYIWTLFYCLVTDYLLNYQNPYFINLLLYFLNSSEKAEKIYLLSICFISIGPYWLMLSLGDFLMVQLFVAVSVYVMQHTNGISSLACFKDSYKRDLWSIIIVYEVSSFVTVTFDAVMRYGKHYHTYNVSSKTIFTDVVC